AHGRNARDGGIEGPDDLNHSAGVGLRVGQDQRVGAFIGGQRGIVGEQLLKVFDHLRGVGVSNRDDLRDHFIADGHGGGAVGGNGWDHRDISLFGDLAIYDFEYPVVANGRVAVLVQDGVQQLDRLVLVERLIAPDVHISLD